MANNFDFFRWISATQNWFTKTERSSGFRAYLIFFIILLGAAFGADRILGEFNILTKTLIYGLAASLAVFIVLYVVKSFQDPNFCRSEKHVENLKRLEITEQKGDGGPIIVMGNVPHAGLNETNPGQNARLTQ